MFGLEFVYLNNSSIGLDGIVAAVLLNPKVAVAIGIEIILGAALGYLMARMARYLLAFIALLVVGAILNVWSLSGSIEDFLMRLGTSAGRLKDIVLGFISTLGLLMVGPVTLGFFIGLVLGLMRK